nr:hypothetical protein [uncultured Flavobacterium sp.]
MSVLALMEAASFYGGVHHKRYSGRQELAPEHFYGFLKSLCLKGFAFKKKLI